MSAPLYDPNDLVGDVEAPVFEETEETERPMPEEQDLLNLLRGYLLEATESRKSGDNPRDIEWELNHDAYWSRYDTSKKAEWQSRHRIPEVANLVERFAATMRQSLVQAGEWFSVDDPLDPDNLVAKMAGKLVSLMLDRSGRNETGQKISFGHEFGAICKAGALTKMCAAVTWDPKENALRIEAVDGRDVFLDPSGRGLYRIRRKEIDRHELEELARMTDAAGQEKLYDTEAIDQLQEYVDEEMRNEKAKSSGTEQSPAVTKRKPIVIHEFLCTILDNEGKFVAENQLVVMANERKIIRGPENNPFWHGRDWIVSAPVIHIPFAVDGKSYVENFREIANSFIEFTNLLHDAVFTSSMNAFVVHLQALEDPSQLAAGVHPNLTILAAEDWPPGVSPLESIKLGTPVGEGFRFWEGMKAMLREASQHSELSLGQVPPKGDITATEIDASTAGQQSMQSSLATDIEEQFLDVILDLTWWTGLQHYDPESDPELMQELGEDVSTALVVRRQEFRNRRFYFRAKGISSMLERGRRVRQLMGFLNVLGGNETLIQAFQKQYSVVRLIEVLMSDFLIDRTRLEMTEQEKATQAQAAAAVPPGAGGNGAQQPAGTPSPAPPVAPPAGGGI